MVRELSIQFSLLLKKDLTAEELEACIAGEDNTCHDFLDANITMQEAFTTVMKRDLDFSDNKDFELCNRAFRRAWLTDYYTL